MNKVVLVGRLTAKPELRYTASNTAYTRFSVAVNRPFANADGKRDADFINVIAWRKNAETISKFFDKGNLIITPNNSEFNRLIGLLLIKENYDRVSVTLPKGTKDRIKQTGSSVNEYIKKVVLDSLE